jgi:hypothetical protein
MRTKRPKVHSKSRRLKIHSPKFTEKTNSREKAQKTQKKDEKESHAKTLRRKGKTKNGIAAKDRKDRKKTDQKILGVKS